MKTDFDVAILGGGLAGNLLARQIHRGLPGVRVAMFERARRPSFKVGEATVELFTNYMLRRLGLSTLLYETQLPKNGLRFFFDAATRDARLEDMTEMGSMSLPYHPSFQIDRMRLETELLRLNGASGVDVRFGTVSDLVLGAAGEPHRFVAESDGKTHAHTARWVIDASGRTSLIAKHKGLRQPTKGHSVAAAWGRFENVLDVDDYGDSAFRERVRYTARRLSTIHFAYEGYWIWFIPIGRGVVSVGVVIDKTSPRYRSAITQQDGFLAFLREHAATARLLENADLLDFQAYGQIAYGSKRIVDGRERWGCTGESAAFTDPFYSPGSDFIALANDFLADLLARDLGGAEPSDVAAHADLYEEYLQYRYRANLLLYEGQYPVLGCYPVMRVKWEFDIQCYYDLWLHAYMQDHHLQPERLRADLRERTFVLSALERFAQMFATTTDRLRDAGAYHARNLGEFGEPLERIGCVKHVGLPMPEEETRERILGCFRAARQRCFDLAGVRGGDGAAPSFADFVTGRAFVPMTTQVATPPRRAEGMAGASLS
ncbi:MAG: tryptophan 7-halogenase [Planctomycetota bacterium]